MFYITENIIALGKTILISLFG